MKIKHCIFLSVLFLCNTAIYSQSDKKIYQVTIFKWVKTNNTDLKKFVKIDSLGNMSVSNKIIEQKVDINTFTKSVNSFVQKEKLEKIPGNDDPPRMALIPKNEEQTLHISIIYLDDYYKESKLANKTYYSWKKAGLKIDDNDYPLYEYLKTKDLSVLKKLLE